MSVRTILGGPALRTARAWLCVAFVVGGARSAIDIVSRRWVLEFQAGPASTAGEKLVAIAQSAAIEALGFGLVGFVLGLVAAALMPRDAAHPRARFLANLACLAAALFLWVRLARIGEEALPFLLPTYLVAWNVGGILGLSLVFLFAAWCLRRINPGWMRRLATWTDERARFPRLPRTEGALLTAAFLSASVAAATFRLSPAKNATTVAEPTPAEPVSSSTDASQPNVVLVTIDTLRADHLGCYGYERPTSPFIDSVARDGAVFRDVSAPAAWTKPSTGTILTGLYPSRHGALYHGSKLRVPDGERTLAESFQDDGYLTAGFVSNPNVKKVFDFDRGFDAFFDSPVEDTVTAACIRGTLFGRMLMRLTRHQFNWKYENDARAMNAHVLPWLQQRGEQPFFLYVHYIDPHIPYSPPASLRREFAQNHGLVFFNKRKELVGRDRYDAEIRYSDLGIEELVGELKRLSLWDNTLFVLTSDHGEEFFEHGVLGHGYSLFQPVIGVPLIVHGPGVPPGTVITQPVQVVDLAATVRSLAGAEATTFGDGHSFAQALADPQWRQEHPYFLENEFGKDGTNHRSFVFNGVRYGDWKLVLTEKNAFFPPGESPYDAEALYNVGSDPQELRNHISEERQLVEDLLTRLRRHAKYLDETGFRNVKPAAIAPEVEAGLRALGYAE